MMKSRFYVALVVVALMCPVAWTAYAQGQRASVTRQMWEYRVDIPSDSGDGRIRAQENQRLINDRASEGWDLVAVSGYFYFKRAK